MASKNKRLNARFFPRTDFGNAEMFAVLHATRVRFDHKQQRWLIWVGDRLRWLEDREKRVRLLMRETVRHRAKNALRLPEDDENTKPEIRFALASEDRHRIDAALELAKSLPSISEAGDGWDANPWLFGVDNGIVDLKTGEVREEVPEDRITKHSSVPFDPQAKCARFERFLREVFDDDIALVEYIQRMVGYCLTGSVEEQCLFCWYGSGANGKTTLSEVLRYILGDHSVNLAFSALEMKNRSSNDLVALAGARLATAAETNEGVRLNEARIKVLTGGDPITARKLYHEAFTFEPTHKLLLAFNHKPIIADDSEGMWRRVRLIPFTRQFTTEEQDRDLPGALRVEAPGILAWAVRGCLRWQKDGLGEPPAVASATAAYREESDHVGEFIEDCCIEEPGATVTSGELWERYKSWTVDNQEAVLSRQTFSERLEKRCFQRHRGHGGIRRWVGLRLPDTTGTQCPTDGPHKMPPDGDTVTQGDVVSDISPTSERIGKFSESASPRVTTSPNQANALGTSIDPAQQKRVPSFIEDL
jgi:putative DNA primase/helicase